MQTLSVVAVGGTVCTSPLPQTDSVSQYRSDVAVGGKSSYCVPANPQVHTRAVQLSATIQRRMHKVRKVAKRGLTQAGIAKKK